MGIAYGLDMTGSGPQAENSHGEPEGGWRQHMPFDVEHRRRKAGKIIRLVDRHRPLAGARVLEIGTGTGVISAELARAAGPQGATTSVDTVDTRVITDGYDFRLTSGVELPFPDASFDVVVSNHVVEHVGDRAMQRRHLEEIGRVLAAGGIGYVATPNRWAVMEPHFHVPALSWPPRRLRDRYLRATGRGRVYDVDPYGPRELPTALDEAGLRWEDVTLDAVEELIRAEGSSPAARLARATPASMRRAAPPVMPTMIYVVRSRA